MAGFQFKPDANKLRLEIEGQTFDVDPFAKNVIAGAAAFAATMSNLEFGDILKPESSEQIDKAMQAIADMVNATLGADAYQKLSAGRDLGIMDNFELATYIATSINNFRAKRLDQFLNDGIAMLKEGATVQ